ncbi:MAG: cation:proton antiporter [Chloroflexi bacterium]|nr:cation:proton antiporter [Chloroflexota bacterium]
MNQTDPIITIAILLALALVGGMIAHRLRQPVILGYLLVGVAVGPHALGLVGDLALIEIAATIGVTLLMFTLGLEISISQLKQASKVGIWGGVVQIVMTFIVGFFTGLALFRWPMSQAAIFGLMTSLSSTAVCLKILMERGELDSVHGRIMIGILILQDIGAVAMMVIVPLMGGSLEALPVALALAVGKALLLGGLAIGAGLWVLPWLMGTIGGVRSRELFLLTVLVLSLGAALATQIFGLSAVFGAFLVGLVMRESRFGHQALAEITPLRDIFATLFFISLGMLLDLSFVTAHWPSILAMVGTIIIIKFLVVSSTIRFFGYGNRIAIIAGAGLFQIGEFAFIIAQAGIKTNLISEQFYYSILASTILTMLLTSLSMSLASRLSPNLPLVSPGGMPFAKKPHPVSISGPSVESGQVLLAGYGRTGQTIAQGLQNAGIPHVIVDIDPERIADARKSGHPCIYGDASNQNVLSHAGLNKARILLVTFPDPVALVTTVKTALQFNPKLRVIARVHRAQEIESLKSMKAVELVNPEYEASLQFLRMALASFGQKETDIRQIPPLAEKNGEFVEFGAREKS